jgi:hypothetical protein
VGDEYILVAFEFCVEKTVNIVIENLEINNFFMKRTLQLFSNCKSLKFQGCLIQIFEDEVATSKSRNKIFEIKKIKRIARHQEEEGKLEEVVFMRCKIKDGAHKNDKIHRGKLKRRRETYSNKIMKEDYNESKALLNGENEENRRITELTCKLENNEFYFKKKVKSGKINKLVYCIKQVSLALINSAHKRIILKNTGKYTKEELRNVIAPFNI